MPKANGEWTAADYARDADEQQAEHNDAMRAELMDDRDAYLSGPDYIDDRPGPGEL